MKHQRAAGVAVSVNTQVDRLTQHELPTLFEVLSENRVHVCHNQLTVAGVLQRVSNTLAAGHRPREIAPRSGAWAPLNARPYAILH